MFNLYEMMAGAQGGAAMANLARLYGLSPEQTRAMVEALMPAFALGLKRATGTPEGMAQFFGVLSRNPYADWFENTSRFFGALSQAAGGRPPEVSQGNDFLALLFGSRDVSRAVAAHAADVTGVGIEVAKAMMPAVGAMIAGGIAHAIQNPAGMTEFVQRAFTPPVPPTPEPPPARNGAAELTTAWLTMMQAMLGQPGPEKPKAAPAPSPSVPDFAAMTAQMQALSRSGSEAFGKLFEAGVDAQKANMDRVAQIIDTMMGSSKG